MEPIFERSRKKRGPALLVAVLSALALLGLVVIPAQAVHDLGVFELDTPSANAVAETLHDWDEVCKDNPADCTFKDGYDPSTGSGATASSHVDDGSLNATIFHGGGSKDGQDITAWRWKDESGGLPDKDNLLHAYAARYNVGQNSLIYFGSDRYSNDGDATQAFWFLQDRVTLTNEVANGAFRFDGTHRDGDLLIISEFSNGGTTSTITVYEWMGGGLVFKAGGPNQKCDGDGGDPFCGIVNENEDPTPSPWTFTDKAGSNDFRQGEFFEAGINLSHGSINLADRCFSSFVAETRSSTSVTATLKDFVIGGFEVCGAEMYTWPSEDSVTPGTEVTDTAEVSGSGVINPPFPSGYVTFFICGPDELTDGVCSEGGAQVGEPKLLIASGDPGISRTVSDPFDTTGKAPGLYCFRGEWPGDDNYPAGASDFGSNECFEVVKYESSIDTAPWVYPNDSATVSTEFADDITGTVRFRLYDDLDACENKAEDGHLLWDSGPIDLPADAATSKTVSTSNDEVKIEADALVYWRVKYSGDDLHYERISRCTETIELIGDDSGGEHIEE